MHKLAIPSPPDSVWHLWIFPIRAYAIAILIGICVAMWWGNKRYVRRGGPDGTILDAGVWMVVFGILGARIYHLITSPDAYFGKNGNPWNAFAIWNGGLGIWGAVLAGAITAWFYLHRHGLRLGPFVDSLAPAVLVAQAIGRLGNYFNQELYGKPTTLPWGLEIDSAHLVPGYAPGTLFHPTFLYELLWCLAGAAVLVGLEKKFKLGAGRLAIAYVMVYTLGRVWIENMRIDTAHHFLGLRVNVWMSIIVFLIAAIAFERYSAKVRRNPALGDIYLPGAAPASTSDDSDDDAATASQDTPKPEGSETPLK